MCTRFCFSESLWWVWGLMLNVILPPYHLAGVSPLPLDVGFLLCVCVCVMQHSPVDDFSAVSFNFGVLTEENECT